MRDFYEILGVSREATQQEIKRAYRQEAKKHHPDLNPGDEEAEHRFKEINTAYEVLSDESKRRSYDLYGEEGLGDQTSGGGFGGFGDIFEDIFDIFGGGFRGDYRGGQQRVPRRGEHIRVEVRLEFKEAVFGTSRKVTIRREEECETCHGEGTKPGTEKHRCETCHGTGQVRQSVSSPFGRVVQVVPCPDCHGTGEIIDEPCEDCHGTGRKVFTRTIEVNIPAGVDNQSVISLRGEGHRGYDGGAPGDLYIYVSVHEDPIFKRHGQDITVEMPISYVDAVLGATLEVPSLDAMETLEIPAGTQSGEVFCLKGKGVPYLRRQGRGDLYVRTEIIVPKKVSKEEREILESLRQRAPKIVQEERKGFFERVKDWFEEARDELSRDED